jgi:hypothetical protein
MTLEQLFNNQSESEFVRVAVADGHNAADARSWYGLRVNANRSRSRGNQELNYFSASGATASIAATMKAEVSKSGISELSDDDNIDVNKYLNALRSLANPLELIKQFGGDILRQIQNEEQLRTDINEQIGITGQLSEDVRNTIIESTTSALRFGFGMNEVSKMFQAMAEITGRANFMSVETANKSYSVARAFVGSLTDVGKLLGEAEKVGLGASDTLDAIEVAGRSSLSLGLNTKKTTELLKNDLGKLNEYGFQNGVEGLNRMVQKSLEFRMNLGEVYKIADKVMNPDSAIELTANLQVLGGAIGDFNDPLKLMYMATNNVEGLQDALIGAASGLATYNQEQGRFEITGVNLRRAKEMASQLGIEYKEFAKGAIAAQERLSVVQDLAGKGFDLSEKDQEFISNLSQMKDGRMVLSIPEDVSKKLGVATETAISDLTQEQIKILTDNQKLLEQKPLEDVAREQFSAVKQIQFDVNAMANRAIRGVSPTVRNIAEDSGAIQSLKEIATAGAKDAVMKSNNDSTLATALETLRQTVKGYANAVGIGDLTKDTLDIINSAITGGVEEQKRIKKFEEEKRKREELTRPKEDLSYNPNKIIKTNIGISFDNMSALFPQVEQKGSYMIPDVMA